MSRQSKSEEVVMAGDGGRVPDVSEQRAEVEAVGEAMDAWLFAVHGTVSSLRASEVGAADVIAALDAARASDPASVLAALLAESPEATAAAIEALLMSDEEAAGHALFDYHHRGSADFDPHFEWADLDMSARSYWCELALVGVGAACRSLLSKAPKGDGDA